MVAWTGPEWLHRAFALVLALVGVPAALSLQVAVQDQPVRLGEPAPRTIVSPDLIRVDDIDATERARRDAAAAVEPVVVDDNAAKAAIVQAVTDAFARAAAVRAPGPDGTPPTRREQVDALAPRLQALDTSALWLLVGLSDEELATVSAEAVAVAQELARRRIGIEDVTGVATDELQAELAVRTLPGGVSERVVAPLIAAALRPTVGIDEAATAEARREAAEKVEPVVEVFPQSSVIVTAGEIVGPIAFAALAERGLQGAEPWRAVLRAAALALLLVAAVGAYLRTYRVKLWRSTRRLLLLSFLFILFTLSVEVLVLAAPQAEGGWRYVLPAGALAMLVTILFDPPIGTLVCIPLTALVAFASPDQPGLAVFAGLASLASVPLVSGRSARADLRRAALPSTASYIVLAVACSVVFGDSASIGIAALAGLLNGVLTAVILNGSLPFLESAFGIVTATGLLDLADRNHPLLRELEKEALGSYNHSIMVSTMVERACRAIGADALLASVAALYHDIGKVRRPYFFVENQFGTPNPHDELEPEVSAIIIQEHVTDGLAMSRIHRLPPEVVDGIATHHGTTLVSYFYRRALEAAARGDTMDPTQVDEDHFRYKGRKPATKEMAVLMLADCCESASRASAMADRNLSRADLEAIVVSLVAERVDDGQLDESALTFRELKVVQQSFVDSLVGVYHPRIAYPAPLELHGSTPVAPAPEPEPAPVPAASGRTGVRAWGSSRSRR